MDLETLRDRIDRIDDEIKRLFEERMDVCQQVAAYKQAHELPILQGDREQAVLARAETGINPDYATGARVLFTNMMDISKCLQNSRVERYNAFTRRILERMCTAPPLPTHPRVACPGVAGSYSHIAAQKVFPNGELSFHGGFEDVFEELEHSRVDFAVLPIENSTAGSVRDVYELVKQYDFFINFETKLKIEHCLAARRGVRLDEITHIYSHEQALAQCSDTLKRLGRPYDAFQNTAMAAEYVAGCSEPIAAICSRMSAELYGLDVLAEGVQNLDENYTRFICISKELYPSDRADLISVALAIPNTAGSLYRLLTKFAIQGLDMTKIESKPLGNKNFDAMFYIDFRASLRDKRATDLIHDLSEGLALFKFLGNYELVD